MTPWLGLDRLFFLLIRAFMRLCTRIRALPGDPEELQLDPNKPVVYVLRDRSVADAAVADQAARRLGLSAPKASLTLGKQHLSRSYFHVYKREMSVARQRRAITPARLQRLVAGLKQNPDLDVQLVPVSVFWGRQPEKESSLWRIIFSNNWSPPGLIKKFLIILTQGRDLYVQFSSPVSLRQVMEQCRSDDQVVRKTSRILRVHFRRQQEAAIGPDLSHRRTLSYAIMEAPSVREAIAEAAAENNESEDKVMARARGYALEIAADYSHTVIRSLELFLNWLWNRLYDGIRLYNLDHLTQVARDHEVIYVPCHRSHIDYLLLSFVVYRNGLVPPHIAAGINLNLPVVGTILRRGGAFFMRRSFRDNPLYAAVFYEYLHSITTRGFSIEYFVEGGRSRSGRMLQPRTGMLAMTVRSFLRDARKPIAFVPVYIGYEKVMEGRSYLGELRGKKKQKESIFGLAKTARKLTNSFGRVAVNFGDPIHLDKVLDDVHESWRHEAYDAEYRPPWLNQAVDNLSQRVASNINASVAVNPIGMTATVLLGTERLAMDEGQLIRLLDKYADLLRAYPYAETITLPEGSGRDWIAYCENMGLITRQPQKLGDIIALEGSNAILMTYYRNNIQHLFALPALIASLFENKASLSREKIVFLTSVAYPYLQSELFLQYDQEKVDAVINQWIDVLVDQGLLIRLADERLGRPEEGTEAMLRSRILSRFIIQTLERYHITLGILRKYGSGNLTAAELEEQSTLLAERMSILFGLNAPEFFDKTLFRNFIANMQKNGVLTTDEDGRLCYGEGLDEVAEDARLVLSVEKRQAIQQVTMLDA
ncbi:MAG TPA: glycerol-3-phosphate 1-O-acyltransferase [Alcanivorax sp.]|nr:glycerol-3-phosphate 1-O-acyltransferase [Alcanivorax sp.]